MHACVHLRNYKYVLFKFLTKNYHNYEYIIFNEHLLIKSENVMSTRDLKNMLP